MSACLGVRRVITVGFPGMRLNDSPRRAIKCDCGFHGQSWALWDPTCPDFIAPQEQLVALSAHEEGAASLYQALLAAGITLASHESDLYCPVSETSRALVEQHRARGSVSTFRNRLDGALWYDIPFAYEPYWTRRQTR